MINDFNSLEDEQVLAADICIIGSGAAGIAIALEFLHTDFKVLVLESGGLNHEPDTQSLSHVDVVGHSNDGVVNGRARALGGSTTLWAGQALPLEPIDFEQRPWVPYSGWAIAKSDLESYYRRAETVMNIGEIPYNQAIWAEFGIAAPDYDPEKLGTSCSQFTSTPNFATLYKEQFRPSAHVDILLHANVINIVSNPDQSAIASVEIKSLQGKTGTVTAKFFIICAGGVESAKLLLMSNQVQKQGLGNNHDLVGRFFQEHLHVQAIEIYPSDRRRFTEIYDRFYRHGVKYSPKIKISDEIQREQEILNVAAEVLVIQEESYIDSIKSLLTALKTKQIQPETLKSLGHILKHPLDFAKFCYELFVKGRIYAGDKAKLYLGVGCEQLPNPQSRIYLSDELDALGVPRAKVDWQLSEIERKSIVVFLETVDAEFQRLNLGKLDQAMIVTLASVADWQNYINDAIHHIGSTRMHPDPTQGVVDSHCLVHGFDNLYIGSSSVFPTGGYSNPTLTLIALSLRIADEIKTRLSPDTAKSGFSAQPAN